MGLFCFQIGAHILSSVVFSREEAILFSVEQYAHCTPPAYLLVNQTPEYIETFRKALYRARYVIKPLIQGTTVLPMDVYVEFSLNVL